MNISRRAAGFTAMGAAAALALSGCTARDDDPQTGSPDGENQIVVAFVPKIQGIPYFEAMDVGGQQAADELGFEWLYQGPTTADAASQADIVRSFIQQGVDVLFVAPNDPDSMAPLLQEAEDAGIVVATTDTDAPDSTRDVFVNQASVDGVGEALTDTLLDAMGGSGRYAIVSCSETASNLNSWIEVQESYTAEAYPDAEIVDVVYAGEDQAAATQLATELMTAHPDLTGLIGECTTSAPGVAQAVSDAGRVGEVFTAGIGTPASMLPYLEEGSSSGAVLWDVEALGYLTGWAGVQLAEGADLEATNAVSDALPAVEYDADSQVLLLGPPTVFTAETAGDYDY